jgi:hypothetical protein
VLVDPTSSKGTNWWEVDDAINGYLSALEKWNVCTYSEAKFPDRQNNRAVVLKIGSPARLFYKPYSKQMPDQAES